MSVLIKGMKMPNGCHLCPFANEYDECCINAFLEDQHEITHYCHLIPIPDHGDLIDRDVLMTRYAEEVRPSNNSDFMRPLRWNDAVQLTELAPVVIPAERSVSPCDNCDERSDAGCSWCKRMERSEE